MTRNIQCVELGRLSVPGMRVKVRWFPQGANDERVWRASSNILSFSRVIGDPILHRDASKLGSNFRPATPVNFWPRSAVWESRRTASQILTVSAYFDTNFSSATVKMKPQGICVDDFSILEMMQLLHDEVRVPGLASHELVEAIGKILRIRLLRLVSQQARAPIGKPCRSVDAAILHGLIGNDGRRFPTTAEMAKQFNTSRRSLLRLFKATTGTAPSSYIEAAKLESAKTFLATSKMTMKQISYEAGYSTPSHFSTKFRQLTGLTPSTFRRRARREDGSSFPA
jgi:AraC-like DNA-binding protein